MIKKFNADKMNNVNGGMRFVKIHPEGWSEHYYQVNFDSEEDLDKYIAWEYNSDYCLDKEKDWNSYYRSRRAELGFDRFPGGNAGWPIYKHELESLMNYYNNKGPIRIIF